MCGIVGIFNVREQPEELRRKALAMSRRIRHRGPDWSGIWSGGSAVLAHERLSIVDPESGGQPLVSPDGKLVLAVNGEIYNHQEIRRRYAGKYAFQSVLSLTTAVCPVASHRPEAELYLCSCTTMESGFSVTVLSQRTSSS